MFHTLRWSSPARLFYRQQTASGSGNVLQNPDYWTNPRFQNSGDPKWIKGYQGTTPEHDSVVMGSSEVPKHATKPSKRLVERIQPYISTAFSPPLHFIPGGVFFFPSVAVVHSQVSRKSYSALGRCEGFFFCSPPPPFPVSSLSLLDRTCWDPLQQPLKSRSGQGWVARRRWWHLRGKHHHLVFNSIIAIVSAYNNFGTVSGKSDNLLIFVASFCSLRSM